MKYTIAAKPPRTRASGLPRFEAAPVDWGGPPPVVEVFEPVGAGVVESVGEVTVLLDPTDVLTAPDAVVEKEPVGLAVAEPVEDAGTEDEATDGSSVAVLPVSLMGPM